MQRISCEHQTYYEKTYSPNPGDYSLRHGFVVLRDRTRYYDHDDDPGDVGDGRAHTGPIQGVIATDKAGRLLGGRDARFRPPWTRCGQSLARQGMPCCESFGS